MFSVKFHIQIPWTILLTSHKKIRVSIIRSVDYLLTESMDSENKITRVNHDNDSIHGNNNGLSEAIKFKAVSIHLHIFGYFDIEIRVKQVGM